MAKDKVNLIDDTESECSYDPSCSCSSQNQNLHPEMPLNRAPTPPFSDETASACTEPSLKSQVSFGDVKIRKYRMILGDHPDVSIGPPISIDWDYLPERRMSLEKYECCRRKRRHGSELLMTNTRRWIIVEKLTDATKDDIDKCMHEVRKVQCQRRKTVSRLCYSKMEATLESFKKLSLRKLRFAPPVR